MKFLLAFPVLLMMASAQASYFQQSCSNAEGTVRTVIDENKESGIFLKSVQFGFGDVTVTQVNEVELHEDEARGEGWVSIQRWFSSKVVITPMPEAEERFKELYPEGKLEDYVVCSQEISGETDFGSEE